MISKRCGNCGDEFKSRANRIKYCKKTHRKEKQYETFFQEILKKAVNSGKPLTDDAEGNPEPSSASNGLEGATTRSESLMDDKSPTSAAPERDDIV